MLTSQTSIGQEVLWDFVAEGMATKISFTGYCVELNRRYITTNKMSLPFTSHKTFRKAFFAWICKMKIDFREHVDPFCGEDPKRLACDGTHLGITAKQMIKLKKPVTSEDKEEIALPLHKRNDRLFLKDDEAREYLLFQAKRALGEAKEIPEKYTGASLLYNNQNLTTQLNSLQKPGIVAMMVNFLNRERHCVNSCAQIFKLLCSSNKSSLTAIFPFAFHKHLQDVCAEFLAGRGTAKDLRGVRKYLPPAATLLEAYKKAQKPMQEAVNFLLQLLELTTGIHEKDRETDTPEKHIEGTYNPSDGCAFYFHKHGCKVRELPKYEVGDESYTKHDCKKLYPKISMGGYGYMFLYFCPEHGHCYGFHLIMSSEGRKDAFYPLLKYKLTPPTDLFYDNACQFSEYSLNREPWYAKFIRFWHDIFHSFTHKCGDAFKSKRVEGLQGVNSEICEQFNAYIQCVKYTSCKMVLNHFMLYVQFMVYLWNRRKTENYKEQFHVALAGTL
jgi:hypothetical protein